VQNEIDTRPPPHNGISVVIDGRNLSIKGDGCGMNDHDISIAKKIGFSNKDPETSVGFRGIGIWSGVAVCDHLIISTKREGEPKKHIISVDAKGIRQEMDNRTTKNLAELLSDHITRTEVDAASFDHGTHVELRGIVRDAEVLLNENEVRKYMSLVLPVTFSSDFEHRIDVEEHIVKHDPKYKCYTILLNREPVFRPPCKSQDYPDYKFDLAKPEYRTIKVGGKDVAYVWYCINKSRHNIRDENSRGLIYKSKNFTVGDRETPLSLWHGPSTKSLMGWCVGEIHVIDTAVRPNAERIDFENSKNKTALTKQLEAELGDLEGEVRTKSARENVRKRLETVPPKVPKKIEFRSEDERIETVAEAVRLRKQLATDLTNPRVSDDLKEKLSGAAPVVGKLVVVMSKAKIVPNTQESFSFTRKSEEPSLEHAEPDVELQQPMISLVEVADSIPLHHLAKIAVKHVEDALNEYFSDDPETLYEIKKRIAEHISQGQAKA
jgi:molecular chaperone HtpG